MSLRQMTEHLIVGGALLLILLPARRALQAGGALSAVATRQAQASGSEGDAAGSALLVLWQHLPRLHVARQNCPGRSAAFMRAGCIAGLTLEEREAIHFFRASSSLLGSCLERLASPAGLPSAAEAVVSPAERSLIGSSKADRLACQMHLLQSQVCTGPRGAVRTAWAAPAASAADLQHAQEEARLSAGWSAASGGWCCQPSEDVWQGSHWAVCLCTGCLLCAQSAA